MADYQLHYWQMPFRGQFIRAILAHAGKRWDEFDDARVAKDMDADVARQAIPYKGPPMLVDKSNDFAIAQMPAIAWYLGERLHLLPGTVTGQALAIKVVNDCNDVIDELTIDGGKQMWTPERWKTFLPRLKRWMAIFEETGQRHELSAEHGYLLGGAHASIADIVCATLWGTVGERFASIALLLDKEAPAVAGLTRRMMATAALANLAAVSRERFGDQYCGGEIEESLRRVVAG